MAILKDEATVRTLNPDFAAIAAYDRPGIIVTAAGSDGIDFVSRYFAPAKGVPEDPVTVLPTPCSHPTGQIASPRPNSEPSKPRAAAER